MTLYVKCRDAWALRWLFGPMGWRLSSYGQHENAWEIDYSVVDLRKILK